jgi:putative zinc finger/helix-turn-helix YgiT family protein
MNCMVCEKGELVPIEFSDTFTQNGESVRVERLQGMQCPVCGADPILAAQAKHNQILIADARRRAQGLLTSSEVKACRDHLGFSQAAAAAYFGGGTHAFSKYERGEVIQSSSMDKLLRVAAAVPEAAQFLKRLYADGSVCTLPLILAAQQRQDLGVWEEMRGERFVRFAPSVLPEPAVIDQRAEDWTPLRSAAA